MRKVVFVLVILLAYSKSFCISLVYLDKYRIPPYYSPEHYKENLVGKTFTFIPVYNSHNQKLVEKISSLIGDYVIKSIVKGNKQKTKKVFKTIWKIQNVITGDEYKIAVYTGDKSILESDYDNLSGDDAVRYYELPLYDLSNWDQDHADFVGTYFTNSLVKAKYKVLNVRLHSYNDREDRSIRVDEFVDVENSITHKISTYRKETVHVDCFKEDLSMGFFSSMTKVEKPENPEIQYGAIKTVTDSLTKYSYEDNFVDIILWVNNKEISFKLQNKSQNSIKILWDDASFVNLDGSSSKIMHRGIKYSERENSQPPSTIVRGAYLDDFIVPTQNVYLFEGYNSTSWEIKPILPTEPTSKINKIQLMLPIQIKGITNEYLFEFDIKYDYLYPERLNLNEDLISKEKD